MKQKPYFDSLHCGVYLNGKMDLYISKGKYGEVLLHKSAEVFVREFVDCLLLGGTASETNRQKQDSSLAVSVGLAAFAAFLQTNVTGPVLETSRQIELLFSRLEKATIKNACKRTLSLRQSCLASLEVDGVSVYPYTPQIELFCLSRWIFTSCVPGDSLPDTGDAKDRDTERDPAERNPEWLRLRIHAWHYKLLTAPNPGPGSVFNKMTQWNETPSLQELLEKSLTNVENQLLSPSRNGGPRQPGTISDYWQAEVEFLLEKTSIHAMLGQDKKAQMALDAATKIDGLEFMLSGALGKRTRFQDKNISQLVVLARNTLHATDTKSLEVIEKADGAAAPQEMPLNNDTLLEKVEFLSDKDQNHSTFKPIGEDPPLSPLEDVSPDGQPQLSSLDQIILLAAATLKDSFSAVDALTLEEILPYATRVLSDKPTNWQVFSQALIVRSRIELHRSRTVERGVLQMQAVVDQVVVDTGEPTATATATTGENIKEGNKETGGDNAVPTIQINDEDIVSRNRNMPTSFLPAPKPTEQAPPHIRLRYIHALATPPRWHLESELAFAWAGIGSIVSALEIFKRLRLWAEVAICLIGAEAADDEGGRGVGGNEKARAILRWQLFYATKEDAEVKDEGGGGKEVDIDSLRAANFTGPERDPLPANAPRLLCLLGDIESNPSHYERAWQISKNRYARAQRSLGEYYLQQHDWDKAREAYRKAVSTNRLDTELWSRLGDISLRLGGFAEAAEAFGRAIYSAGNATGGEEARTWSNMGSALYSLYTEKMKEKREREAQKQEEDLKGALDAAKDNEDGLPEGDQDASEKDPALLLSQSLAAYKRGASIAHDNWRIWDNVVTLASRARPPIVDDMVLGLRNVVMIRNTEEAIDSNMLRVAMNEAVLAKPKPEAGTEVARGTSARAVCDLIEESVVPLITIRSDLWEIVMRERIWRGDLAGAIDAAEKGWRAAMGGGTSGSLGSTVGRSGDDADKRNWLENVEAWQTVVERTDELVSVLENYGPDVCTVGSRWKMKARSALRSVMGKGKQQWEGSTGWLALENLLDGLK